MARVSGPLFSISASGSIADVITYSIWKNKAYVRERVIPYNPKSSKQVNVRTALTLLVAEWQGLTSGSKDSWTTYADQFKISGFNMFCSRGMNAYVIQLTTSVTPVSVGVTGIPPAEVWTWA